MQHGTHGTQKMRSTENNHPSPILQAPFISRAPVAPGQGTPLGTLPAVLPASLLRGERRPEHAGPGVVVGLSHPIFLQDLIPNRFVEFFSRTDQDSRKSVPGSDYLRQVSSYLGALQFLRGDSNLK